MASSAIASSVARNSRSFATSSMRAADTARSKPPSPLSASAISSSSDAGS